MKFTNLKKKMIPVRCFTCNKLLGQLYHIQDWNDENFIKYQIKRFCCKKILKHSIDVHEKLKFPSNSNIIQYKNHMETKRMIIPR